MKKLLAGLALVLATTICAVSCTPSTSGSEDVLTGKVSFSGSSALFPLAEAAIEPFNEKYPEVVITANAGGSGTGLSQVADGTVDIGNSDLFAEEKLDAEVCKTLVDNKVCIIVMAPIVNESAGVTNLTTEQLIKVFTAEVTNWSEVGGNDEEITLVGRPEGSGTKATFTEYALNGTEEASEGVYQNDNSGELLEKVKTTDGAVGYIAISYLLQDVESVVKVDINGVSATNANAYNGTYTVWAYEHMYTKVNPSKPAQAFVEFMMSDEYASNIEALGYGVTSQLSTEAVDSHK